MDLALTLCEGRAYADQLRGGQLALALAQRFEMRISSEKSDAFAPWRAMLSGPEQLRLRELDTPPTTASGVAQAVWYRTGLSIPLRPQAGCWLVLGGDTWAATPEMVRYYERVLLFSPFKDEPLAAYGEVLPIPVDTAIFRPTNAPRDSDHVVVLATGDGVADAAMVHWLRAAGVAQVTVFDPYAWPMEQGEGRVGVCGAAARAALFSRCTAVVSAEGRVRCDNHLVWEAVATGAQALALHAAPNARAWNAQTVMRAWQSVRHGQPAAHTVTFADWQDLVAHFAPGHQGAVPPLPAAERCVGHHHVRHFADVDGAATLQPVAEGMARVGIVMPGAGAVCDAAVQGFLAAYDTLFVDTTQNAQFLVPLFRGIFLQHAKKMQKPFPTVNMLQNSGDVRTCLTQQLGNAAPCVVDLVHIHDRGPRMREMRDAFAGLATSDAGAVPTLLVHSDKIYNTAAPPVHLIGASVASHGIVGGLLAVEHGRCHITWLPRKGPATARGRLAMYPYPEAVGIDQDEVDYASLPALLQRDAVDVLLHPDPVITGSLAARAWWARKAVPVVGMLHSIHAAQTATDAVFQLLNAPTFHFDVIVSPSRCGATAYNKLLASASAWLGTRMATAPTFNGRIVTLPYGIDGAFYRGLHRPSCRLAMDLPRDAVVLLSLGRLSRVEKADLMPLLLALRGLRQRNINAYWVLGGGDSPENYGDTLRTMAQALGVAEHVRVVEDVVMYDKVLLYGAADIFVAISDNLQETYGLTLLEAMAAGLPVVAAAWDGYRELVRHDDTGLLVPTAWWPPEPELLQVQRVAEGAFGYGYRDVHELAAVDNDALRVALEALCRNDELRQSMGARGQAVCAQEYDAATQGKRLVELCREKVAQARAHTWKPVAAAPFFDPVHERFAHYPTRVLAASHHVRVSDAAQDGAWMDGVLGQTDWGGDSERKWARRIVAAVQAKERMSLGELGDALATDACPATHVQRRVARCVKVGLLRVDEP